MPERIRGVWCATLTPLDRAGAPDHARLAAHIARLIAAGVDGVALFGTTGEGQSFSMSERRAGLDAVLAGGVPAARIIAGTGCAALTETVELTRHAVAAGCAGALVLPPFFFKGVSEEGLYASYARLIDAVADTRLRLYLYHIPQVTAVPIAHEVVARLLARYSDVVAGIKDSGGDLQHTRRLLARFASLAIFVGHEPHLPEALAGGGAGTICGIANLYPRLMRRLHDLSLGGDPREELRRIDAFLARLERYPLFAAFKALLADLTADPAWEALRPPLVALDAAQRREWIAAVAETGIVAKRDAA
ncbi:MAG TPA: dihydrodipicolinate synthase family protein [Casimicrobiaceae bacterium]|nr:dihydrodipicolinate synthase family protein [Casimicrobiaceae bacterium]